MEIWLVIAAKHGMTLREDAFIKARAAADAMYHPRVYEFRGRMMEYWDLYHRYMLNRLGIADAEGNLLRAVNSTLLDAKRWYQVFPETLPVLSKLKEQGYELGLISNSTEGILERLKNLGLSRYLDVVVYSQEAGAEKPDPAPFELALRRAGRSAAECIFVGDSPERDIVGAKGVGIRPILIDRKGEHQDADCATIRNLNEILD